MQEAISFPLKQIIDVKPPSLSIQICETGGLVTPCQWKGMSSVGRDAE